MYQIEHYLSQDGRDLFPKRKQKADIENAVDYWNDWQRRNRK